MEFGPIRFPTTTDVCSDCGAIFDHINEEAIEDRCPSCQSKFRIAASNEMHAKGVFIGHAGYLMAAHKRRFLNNEVE